jgi:MFS family permease
MTEPVEPTDLPGVGGRLPQLSPAAAFAEPIDPVGRAWVTSLTVANVGMWAAFLGPLQVLLAEQADDLAPGHKTLVFGLVAGMGAVVSVIATPVFGAWSDRTTSRHGRRLPWVVGGAAVSVVALLVLATAPNVAVMAMGWCLAQVGLNAMLAALSAAVPDLVPVRQRGAVGGWLGVAQTVGVVGGAGIAAATSGIAIGYVATAAMLAVLVVPYCVRSLDRPIAGDRVSRLSVREFVGRFWISPREHPDFAWAWVTRFAVNLGNWLGTLYLLYYLDDDVHYDDPDTGVFILSAVYAVVLIGTTVVGGIWSDRIGRRKPFVVASGIVTGAAALTLAAFPTWTGAIVGAVILGAGFGVYLSVDFALVTEVLPTAVDRARDLGVITVAVSLSQVVAPAVAAPIVALTGGYVTLYVVAALVCFVGSAFVGRIESVA